MMEAIQPRVLFLSDGGEDYLSDGVFHGLRCLLGVGVVDVPRLAHMYHMDDSSRARVYGRGFTLYGLLDELHVERDSWTERVEAGEFDLIILGNVHRSPGALRQILRLRRAPMIAVLDGADAPNLFPVSWLQARQGLLWEFGLVHRKVPYFKREWTPFSDRSRFLGVLPGAVAAALPRPKTLRPIAFSIPEEKVISPEEASLQKKTQLFASHVVDAEVADRVGGSTGYAFSSEQEYYADLGRSRFGVTTRRAGWDCLRHYEIAARGAVPCFRALDAKPPSCAPHGIDASMCVIYQDARALLDRVAAMSEVEYEHLRRRGMAWVTSNTTRVRASEVLSSLGFDGRARYLPA